MYKQLQKWCALAAAVALLCPAAGYLPANAADADTIGFTDYETFAYTDATQMLDFNFGNLRGEVIPSDGDLVILAPTSNGQGSNGIKKNGAVQSRTYIVETRFKLDYPENPSGSAAIIIYDGEQRNDYRFFPTFVNHRNGDSNAFKTFNGFPHESGKWYTYRFESDGEGMCMTYRKADGETDFTPVFPEKQPLPNNTGAKGIDMFAEGSATNIGITIDYLKTYYPFEGTLGDGTDAGLQSAYLEEPFASYGDQTVTVDTEQKNFGSWKLSFKDASTTQAVFDADGTLTLNANGDTQTLSCDANLEEFHDVVFDIRFQLTGSMAASQGLGIQINGETDRVFVRVNNQRIHYNKGEDGWINNTVQTPLGEWINLRIEKIGAKANVYCKSDSDAEYTQVFANMDTIPKTAKTNYFVSLFIEQAADMAVTIDSVSLHAAGSYCVAQSFDGAAASTYKIADYSELNTAVTRDFNAFLASYGKDGQKLQAIAAESLSVGAGESGTIPLSLPQSEPGSTTKSLLWDTETLHPLYPVAIPIP